MRILLIIVGLLIVLAAPSQAQAGGNDVARDASVYAVAAPSESHTNHCQHVPCDSGCEAMQHAPCACGAFAHFGNPHGQAGVVARASERIAFDDETLTGRSLLPPVPPPL